MSAGDPRDRVPESGPEYEIEPERYELLEPAGGFEATRRDFLRLVGGGLVVLCVLSESEQEAEAQQAGRGRRRGGGGGGPVPREISAWLHIAEDGTVTAHTGKAEVGQDIRTSLSQAVADELRIPLESVRLVMADTAVVPFDMGTFGSRTTPTMSVQLRRAAASARERLLDLAAEQWKADRARLEVAGGKVTDRASGQSAGFGALTHGRKLVEAIAADVALTPAEKWTVAGRPAAKVDGRDFVTGRHRYASDVKRPGMLHGKVLRPPMYQIPVRPADRPAGLKSVNLARAQAMPGVTVVRDGDFVGVVAPDEPTAARALAAIEAEWMAPEHPVSDRDLYDGLRRHAQGGPSRASSRGDAAASAGQRTREASYTIAYIAHAPLETRTAVAEWEGDRLTVWTGSQRPFGVRSELAQALGVPEDRVRVIVPDTGAGYGGKHNGEAAIEAARLARGAGRPVKRHWTREEEFTWAYFRPAGVIDARASVGKDGKLVSWDFHNYNSGGSGVETPYDVPRRQSAFHASQSPLRQGSYRALASTANHFARESLMDELAVELGLDPLAFRLANLSNDRLRGVFQAAAERFGWGKNPNATAGRGCGIAGGTEKGGYVATCAEVEVDRARGQVKVVRLVAAFDCGPVVNPDLLANQVEGALVMGLGGALFEAIRFDGGQIKNPRFSRYRVPRFSDMPEIDVVLVDRKEAPLAGAGETPIIAVAPAIANAIHAACGVRLRSLPLVPDGLKV